MNSTDTLALLSYSSWSSRVKPTLKYISFSLSRPCELGQRTSTLHRRPQSTKSRRYCHALNSKSAIGQSATHLVIYPQSETATKRVCSLASSLKYLKRFRLSAPSLSYRLGFTVRGGRLNFNSLILAIHSYLSIGLMYPPRIAVGKRVSFLPALVPVRTILQEGQQRL